MESEQGKLDIILVDHHPADPVKVSNDHVYIDMSRSAAGSLHVVLGSDPNMEHIVALADHHERYDTCILQKETKKYGMSKIKDEADIFDRSWRSNITDDTFRLDAAKALSKGIWPSEAQEIYQRHCMIIKSGSWEKALDNVRAMLRAEGHLAIVDLGHRRLSMYGFGSKALEEVAFEEGCDCAIMLADAPDGITVSLRGIRGIGRCSFDLGEFIGSFTKDNGGSGGGHFNSAGGRIPSYSKKQFIEELSGLIYALSSREPVSSLENGSALAAPLSEQAGSPPA